MEGERRQPPPLLEISASKVQGFDWAAFVRYHRTGFFPFDEYDTSTVRVRVRVLYDSLRSVYVVPSYESTFVRRYESSS